MKPIELTQAEWAGIHRKLAKRYEQRPSVLLIRNKMREELGFTVRRHRVYHEQRGSVETILLDFYSEQAATMFRMTYL